MWPKLGFHKTSQKDNNRIYYSFSFSHSASANSEPQIASLTYGKTIMISSTHTLIAKAALILLVTGLSAGCSSALRYDNETQRQLVEHAQVIERINQPAAEIWPGFWSARPSYILYQRQGPALVVSDTTPEGDYQQLTPRFYYFP